MMVISPDGKPEYHKEYRNSHGAAAFVWAELADRYLDTPWMFAGERLWGLASDARMAPFEIVVLRWTFDRVAVRRGDFGRLADAMDAFVQRHPSRDSACHLPSIARDLRALVDSDVMGACWNQTSVASNIWIDSYLDLPDDDWDTDPAVYHNFLSENGHKWLYEEAAL